MSLHCQILLFSIYVLYLVKTRFKNEVYYHDGSYFLSPLFQVNLTLDVEKALPLSVQQKFIKMEESILPNAQKSWNLWSFWVVKSPLSTPPGGNVSIFYVEKFFLRCGIYHVRHGRFDLVLGKISVLKNKSNISRSIYKHFSINFMPQNWPSISKLNQSDTIFVHFRWIIFPFLNYIFYYWKYSLFRKSTFCWKLVFFSHLFYPKMATFRPPL